jgi:hypothetical protein
MTAAGLFCFIELRSATLLVSEPNLSDSRKFQGLGRSTAHRSPAIVQRSPAIVQRLSRALTLDTNWGHPRMAPGLDAHSFDSARINLRFGTVGLSKLRPKTQTMKLQAATDSAFGIPQPRDGEAKKKPGFLRALQA